MTYTDRFGIDHHNHHCACPKCNIPCAYNWPIQNPTHVCTLGVADHGIEHICKCGQKTRVRHEPRTQKPAEAWWDPGYVERVPQPCTESPRPPRKRVKGQPRVLKFTYNEEEDQP